MMRLLVLVPPALLIVLATACGSSAVDITGYDQTCSLDTECIAVPAGDACECDCNVDAVNGRDAAAYMDEWNGKNTTCTNGKDCAVCPALPIAACKNGKCAVK